MTRQPAVYVLTNKRNGALYTGVTSDLVRRIWEHRHHLVEGFTSQYNVHKLIYFELHDDITQAIIREKQIKKWRRAWKLRMIEAMNPDWKDLYDSIL